MTKAKSTRNPTPIRLISLWRNPDLSTRRKARNGKPSDLYAGALPDFPLVHPEGLDPASIRGGPFRLAWILATVATVDKTAAPAKEGGDEMTGPGKQPLKPAKPDTDKAVVWAIGEGRWRVQTPSRGRRRALSARDGFDLIGKATGGELEIYGFHATGDREALQKVKAGLGSDDVTILL